ncbi:MAG: hypothetical protein ACFCBW_15235 [Candidatus Competibacterales bacterium]
MSAIARLTFAIVLAVVLFRVCPSVVAQPQTQRLEEINLAIETLTRQLTEKASNYPDVIVAIRERRESIARADEEVQQLIEDLNDITAKMDVQSDYRNELKALEEQVGDLVAQLEVRDDAELDDLLAALKDRYSKIQDIDQRRAEAVIEARAVVRDLERNKERLVLVKQIGDIDAAIKILEGSVGEFEKIVTKASEVAAAVTVAVSSP